MNILKSSLSKYLIIGSICLVVGYKLSPKPSHTIQTKTEYIENIKYIDREVYIDRVITQYPDGRIVTEEKDRSHERSLDQSIGLTHSHSDTSIIDKNHQLFLGKWSDQSFSIGYSYKLYSTDKFDIDAHTQLKSNIIDMNDNQYMIGIGIRF